MSWFLFYPLSFLTILEVLIPLKPALICAMHDNIGHKRKGEKHIDYPQKIILGTTEKKVTLRRQN